MARYWLAQCEGFRVKGSPSGTVEKVVGSVDEQSAESLVVRTAWRRRSVPIDAVDAVVPAARLLVVDDRSGQEAETPLQHGTRALAGASSHAAGAVAATVVDKAPPLARLVRDLAVTLVLLCAAAIVMLARALGAAAVRAGQLATLAFARLTAPPRRPR